MVAPVSSLAPADGLVIYRNIIHQASEVFAAITALYEPDIQSPDDWAARTVLEATGQRRELQLRLLTTVLQEGDTVTLRSTLSHYLNTHWADYEQIMPNPVKRQQVLQLHATLEELKKETVPLTLALRQ